MKDNPPLNGLTSRTSGGWDQRYNIIRYICSTFLSLASLCSLESMAKVGYFYNASYMFTTSSALHGIWINLTGSKCSVKYPRWLIVGTFHTTSLPVSLWNIITGWACSSDTLFGMLLHRYALKGNSFIPQKSIYVNYDLHHFNDLVQSHSFIFCSRCRIFRVYNKIMFCWCSFAC